MLSLLSRWTQRCRQNFSASGNSLLDCHRLRSDDDEPNHMSSVFATFSSSRRDPHQSAIQRYAMALCLSVCLSVTSRSSAKMAATIRGGSIKTGLFLRVDNFATVRGRKACDMPKFSKFCLEKKNKTKMSHSSIWLCTPTTLPLGWPFLSSVPLTSDSWYSAKP